MEGLWLIVSALLFATLPSSGELNCNFVMEFMWVQDFSGSFGDDRVSIQNNLANMLNYVNDTNPGSTFGLTTFVDKPLNPFGSSSDWCHRVHVPMGDDTVDNIVTTLTGVSLGFGQDAKENQLGVLHDLAKSPTLAGWTDRVVDEFGQPVLKVVALVTDASYHAPPDGFVEQGLVPNDGDGYTDCTGEDYPSVAQTGSALAARSIHTIFFLQHPSLVAPYQTIFDTTVANGHISPLSGGSNDIYERFVAIVSQFGSDTCASSTLDIAFAHDVTFSYDDNKADLHAKIDSITQELQAEYVTPQFALTTFGDKPLAPLGRAATDYCYRCDQAMTFNRNELLASVDNVKMISGWDWRESQLDAMISTVLDPAMGWRTGSSWNGFDLHRIVVIATDSGYHTAPHAANAGHVVSPHSGGMVNCTGEEYPTTDLTADILLAQDVHPLFVATSDVVSTYRNLLDSMNAHNGLIGEVVELQHFAELPDVVVSGVRRLEAKLRGLRQVGGSDLLGNFAGKEDEPAAIPAEFAEGDTPVVSQPNA